MINELYELSKVLHNEDIKTQSWHRKYQPIPNIRSNAPCVCIKVSAGKVIGISSVDAELGKILRKYGSNQGSYPCMNLAPLYRITDDTKKKKIADLGNHPEKIDDACIAEMRAWCTENTYNWSKKFQGKYKISMEKRLWNFIVSQLSMSHLKYCLTKQISLQLLLVCIKNLREQHGNC